MSKLTISGHVHKFVNVTPARVVLNGEVGTPLKIAVRISPATNDPLEITEAKADRGQDILLTLTRPKDSGDNTYLLTVENKKETKGRYQDTIRLHTTDKEKPEIVLPVWGNIRPPQIAYIKPRYVMLKGPAGTPIQSIVTIIPRDKYPFTIDEITAQSGDHIKWDLKESEEGGKKSYILTVRNLRKEKGRYYDSIFLKTDHPEMPQIKISVSGIILDENK